MSNRRSEILNNLKDKPFKKLIQERIEVNPFSENEGELIDVFKNELENVDGEVVICNDKDNLNELLLAYLEDNKLDDIYTFNPDYIQLFKNKGINASKMFRDNIDVSITSCEFLSARTGTVVVSSKVTGRRINIFAPTHIVLAKKSQIVSDIDEAFVKIKEKYSALPSAISYITGPSRTADIEKTLIIGAHGPKKLIVFIENN